MGLFGLILVYLLGGLTFIPLLLFSILIHAYLTFPIHENDAQVQEKDELLRPGDSAEIIKAATKGLEEKFQPRGSDDAEAGAGYFAVCREYVPGGVGAVLVRNTPVGNTVITSPSPSVYQSMYRSIFDRKQGPNPLEQKGTGKSQRKGGNVFYVVLR
jgi:DNA polymerase zeta